MAKRTGFGTVKGVLDDAVDARHVIELRFGVAAKILGISACYTQETAALAPLAFNAGMVLVIRGSVPDNALFYPDPYSGNQWRSGATAVNGPDLNNPLFEARWGSEAEEDHSRFFSFGPGLLLEKDVTYSVILPIPGSNDQPVGSFPNMFGVLSVQGEMVYGKDPIGDLR